MHRSVGRLAWDWLLLSYGANFCVRFSPDFLAAAFLYCSIRHLNLRVRVRACLARAHVWSLSSLPLVGHSDS